MPRLVDYSKSIIYKLCSRNPSIKDIYVGSTSNLTRRKCQHKIEYESVHGLKYNTYLNQFIRAHGGFENWDVVMIEEYKDCKNILELKARVHEIIELYGATLNKKIPKGTIVDFNVEQKKKKRAKLKISEKDGKLICDCGSRFNRNNVSRHNKTKKHIRYMEELNKEKDPEPAPAPEHTDTPIEIVS